MIVEKPLIGMPCNSCGICCQAQVCRNGAFVLKLVKNLGDTVPGPCPALINENGLFKCGVVLYPKKYIKSFHGADKLREAFKKLIGSGDGCDELGDDEGNPIEEAKLDAMIDKWKDNPNFIYEAQKALRIVHGL